MQNAMFPRGIHLKLLLPTILLSCEWLGHAQVWRVIIINFQHSVIGTTEKKGYDSGSEVWGLYFCGRLYCLEDGWNMLYFRNIFFQIYEIDKTRRPSLKVVTNLKGKKLNRLKNIQIT